MRKNKHKIHRNKKLSKECWNLNSSLLHWLEEHLTVYKKDASKLVDLEYNIIDFNGETKSFKEWLDILISMIQEYKYIDSINIHELQEMENKTVHELLESLGTYCHSEEEFQEIKDKDKKEKELIKDIFDLLGVLFPYLWW